MRYILKYKKNTYGAVLITAVLALSLLFSNNTVAKATSIYNDLPDDAWYKNAAEYCVGRGFMYGTAEGTFSPEHQMTRAMFVMSLASISGNDISCPEKPLFRDVDENVWYASASAWAEKEGIAVGENDYFYGDRPISRVEAVQMLYRMSCHLRIPCDYPVSVIYDNYSDTADVKEWARIGMKWAVEATVVSGRTEYLLEPNKTLTRAEAAQMLYVFSVIKETGEPPRDTSEADDLQLNEGQNRIICWGDSLTAGANVKYPYPLKLQNIIGIKCWNYGVGGETAQTIAQRQGAIPVFVRPFIIPKEKNETEIELRDEYGHGTSLGVFGYAGLNRVTIRGVAGSILYRNGKTVFVRDREGCETVISRTTRIITKGMENRKTGDILILFCGTNNGYSASDVGELIELYHSMIDYAGVDRYIVVSFTAKSYMPQIDAVNAALKNEFGEHYLDFRTYMLTDALSDAGLSPTEDDISDISQGEIPSSFRSDSVHGNEIFYELLAQMTAEKLRELDYIE